MDLSKLTIEEINNSLRESYPNNELFSDPYHIANITYNNVVEGNTYPIPIVDLYIASNLNKMGVKIPSGYNTDLLPHSLFIDLTKIYYLSPNDNEENRIRAKRITRILLDLNRIGEGIKLIPSGFKGRNKEGDFSWMINRPEYNDVLFIFNDNQVVLKASLSRTSQFIAFIEYLRSGENNGMACSIGGGNAVIRPYQCLIPPKAAGIPTGSRGVGYQNLDAAKPYIDIAIEYINGLLKSGNYKRVMYSASRDGRTLGASIFSPSIEVKEYIVSSLENLF